jgi:multicomponent Na+:H+ antiporter subunit B
VEGIQQSEVEDYYTVRSDRYFRTYKDVILSKVGSFLVPCILVYGVYVLLNGQLSPGGGFSGGAVMGAAMIIFAASSGFDKVDKFFSVKLSSWVTFAALGFYSFAKGYVFFTGANGIHNGIPKGTPGAILSGGLILPLDVAVGLVVACTMFGFYSLFRRGNIGGSGK